MCIFRERKKTPSGCFPGLEVALARESHRGENEPVETTRQELSTDTLQETDGGRVVIADVALRGEAPALQLPSQGEGHQPAVAFPAMLWQGVAVAHGGELVCERPGNCVSLLVADTHAGEAGDEVGHVPETLVIAAPRPRPVEQVSLGDTQVGQSRGRTHSRRKGHEKKCGLRTMVSASNNCSF